ncbi:MAG TPA: hypothetical protein DD422_09270 [Akkermansia sp.]|nr:hypothetical protein [Akkermansia sp.]HBN18228.1 hypothetical protein [Akkermansia sp.]
MQDAACLVTSQAERFLVFELSAASRDGEAMKAAGFYFQRSLPYCRLGNVFACVFFFIFTQ